MVGCSHARARLESLELLTNGFHTPAVGVGPRSPAVPLLVRRKRELDFSRDGTAGWGAAKCFVTVTRVRFPFYSSSTHSSYATNLRIFPTSSAVCYTQVQVLTSYSPNAPRVVGEVDLNTVYSSAAPSSPQQSRAYTTHHEQQRQVDLSSGIANMTLDGTYPTASTVDNRLIRPAEPAENGNMIPLEVGTTTAGAASRPPIEAQQAGSTVTMYRELDSGESSYQAITFTSANSIPGYQHRKYSFFKPGRVHNTDLSCLSKRPN